jgi:hypothetical protein
MTRLSGHLIVVALVSAVAEVVLLRIALRLGPVLPAQIDVLPFFTGVERMGVVALNVGVLAASLLIGVAALDSLRSGGRKPLLAVTLFGAVLVNLGLGPLVGLLPDGSPGLLHGVVTSAAILLTIFWSSQPRPVAIVLSLVALAQVLALAQAVAGTVARDPADAFGGRPIVAAEAIAVLSALILPWLCRVRPRRGEVVIGAAAGLAVTVGGAIQPWGLATVAIWTMAFSLFLSPILYGAAVTSVMVAGLALRRQPGGVELAAGLALVWLAGLKLDISSFALMALAGLTIASGLARTPVLEASVGFAPPGWRFMAVLRRPVS